MNQERLCIQELIEKGIKAINQMIEEIHLFEQNKEMNDNHLTFINKIDESNMKIAQMTSEWHSLIVTNPLLFE